MAHTAPSRYRYVDLLRAGAIVLVVSGHWLVAAVVVDGGRPGGENLLGVVRWTHWGTWAFQVMPVFFLVGGYANAASWVSARRRGEDGVSWLARRCRRLLVPTTVFLAVGVLAGQASRIVMSSGVVEDAGWLVTIALWFLAVYLAVTAATPVLHAAHVRYGLAVPVALVGVVAGVDALSLGLGVPLVGRVNTFLLWACVHQIGFSWRDGRLVRGRRGRWVAAALVAGGLPTLIALTTAGPYPVSMVGVPGADIQNTSPPSLALLALAATQIGFVLSLRHRGERLCARPAVWAVTVAMNAVILTIYLWHMVPVVIGAAVLAWTPWISHPATGTAGWWALRVPWLAFLALILTVIVRLAGRWELTTAAGGLGRQGWTGPGPARTLRRPPAPSRRAGHPPTRPAPRAVLTAFAGVLAICAGLLRITAEGLAGGPGAAGVPIAGLGPYAAGMLLLARAGGGDRTAEPDSLEGRGSTGSTPEQSAVHGGPRRSVARE